MTDMPLFRNILDFRNSNSVYSILFNFVEVLLMILERNELIFAVSGVKQPQWWHSFSNSYFIKLKLETGPSDMVNFPVGIYFLKVNNRNTRTRCAICSKLIIKTPERRHTLSM